MDNIVFIDVDDIGDEWKPNSAKVEHECTDEEGSVARDYRDSDEFDKQRPERECDPLGHSPQNKLVRPQVETKLKKGPQIQSEADSLVNCDFPSDKRLAVDSLVEQHSELENSEPRKDEGTCVLSGRVETDNLISSPNSCQLGAGENKPDRSSWSQNRIFKDYWLKLFPWSFMVGNLIFCHVCISAGKKGRFTEGKQMSKMPKKDNLSKHDKCITHMQALKLLSSRGGPTVNTTLKILPTPASSTPATDIRFSTLDSAGFHLTSHSVPSSVIFSQGGLQSLPSTTTSSSNHLDHHSLLLPISPSSSIHTLPSSSILVNSPCISTSSTLASRVGSDLCINSSPAPAPHGMSISSVNSSVHLASHNSSPVSHPSSVPPSSPTAPSKSSAHIDSPTSCSSPSSSFSAFPSAPPGGPVLSPSLLMTSVNSAPSKSPVNCPSAQVCELHFRPDDIERETSCFDTRTGRTLTAKLGILRLRKGAVPSKFHRSLTQATNVGPDVKKLLKEWLSQSYEACPGNAIEQMLVYHHCKMYMEAKGRKKARLNPIQLSNCVRKLFGTGVGPSKQPTGKWHYHGIRPRDGIVVPPIPDKEAFSSNGTIPVSSTAPVQPPSIPDKEGFSSKSTIPVSSLAPVLPAVISMSTDVDSCPLGTFIGSVAAAPEGILSPFSPDLNAKPSAPLQSSSARPPQRKCAKKASVVVKPKKPDDPEDPTKPAVEDYPGESDELTSDPAFLCIVKEEVLVKDEILGEAAHREEASYMTHSSPESMSPASTPVEYLPVDSPALEFGRPTFPATTSFMPITTMDMNAEPLATYSMAHTPKTDPLAHSSSTIPLATSLPSVSGKPSLTSILTPSAMPPLTSIRTSRAMSIINSNTPGQHHHHHHHHFHQHQQQGDEFQQFCLTVAAQLRSMPLRAALEVQLEIHKLITAKRVQLMQ